jgi:hypothetical protein
LKTLGFLAFPRANSRPNPHTVTGKWRKQLPLDAPEMHEFAPELEPQTTKDRAKRRRRDSRRSHGKTRLLSFTTSSLL